MTTVAKIKTLEYISYMCAVIPVFFMNLSFIYIAGCCGLLLQVPIYKLYKSQNRSKEYITNKLGALIVGTILILILAAYYNFR